MKIEILAVEKPTPPITVVLHLTTAEAKFIRSLVADSTGRQATLLALSEEDLMNLWKVMDLPIKNLT